MSTSQGNQPAVAYPLTWPRQFPRTRAPLEQGRFKATLAASLKNVQDSLRLFASDSGKKLEGLVISSNVTLGVTRPQDPGVAVWFVWDGLQVCIAVDRYSIVESNLQAIHHIIEARRVELRHGTLALVRATFTGFLSLPAPAEHKDCWRLLQIERQEASIEKVQAAYRQLASAHHPDHGGDPGKMAELNQARDEAIRELS